MNLSDLAEPTEAKPMNLADLAEKPAEPPKPMNLSDLAEPQGIQGAGERIARASGVPESVIGLAKQSPFPTPEMIRQSPIGKVLDVLNMPQGALVGLGVRLLDKVTPGIQGQINPNRDIFPDAAWHDVINYYSPKTGDIEKFMKDNGYGPLSAGAAEYAYRGAKFGVGLAADIVGDPLFFMNPKVGQLTHAAEEAYKVGKFEAATERNLISANYPFSKKPLVEIPLKPVTEAISSAKEKAATQIAKVPGGQAAMDAATRTKELAGDLIDSFSPWTHNPEVDATRVGHTVAQEADRKYIETIAKSYAEKKFTDAETDVINAAIERTPNLSFEAQKATEASNVYNLTTKQDREFDALLRSLGEVNPTREQKLRLLKMRTEAASKWKGDLPFPEGNDVDLINKWIQNEHYGDVVNARKALLEKVNKPEQGNLNIEAVRNALFSEVKKVSLEKKIPITDARVTEIVESSLAIKAENAKDLLERIKAGKGPADGTGIIEGYLAHRISPEGKKFLKKNPAMAAAHEEASIVQQTERSLNGKTVSSYDAGKRTRTIRSTLEEANAIMKEKTGVAGWFIKDPMIATIVKRGETRKMLRDSELLDTLSKHGRSASELRRDGIYWVDENGKKYLPIKHPEFEKKTLVIQGKKGQIKKTLDETVFPKEIASKVSYDILPRNSGPVVTNVNAFLDSYNRTFRSFALFRPDYHLENWIDNILKNMTNGVRIESYSDAARALMGKEGLVKMPGGKTITTSELKRIFDKYPVAGTGTHFSEGLERVLYTGKRVSQEHGLRNKLMAAGSQAKNIVHQTFAGMNIIGEKGERFTRYAFFTDLLKRGYSPGVAAMEVEKFLFNFKRTTETMDYARRFYNPFIQAAFKTAEIAPSLLGKKAYLWNAYENNLMSALQSSFNDPVSNWSVQQLYPEYFKMADRIAGPLLPANHWLAAMAGYGPNKQVQLPLAVALGLPGGLGIVNQLTPFFDSTALKQAEGAPVLRSLSILLTGTDPWSKQDFDLVKDAPEFSSRLRGAVAKYVTSVFALPNAEKYLAQKLGLTNPNYIEPATIMAWHGMMGKFGKVTNLEKEFMTRLTFLVRAEKELNKKLYSEAAKEFTGRTLDIKLADKPALREALNLTMRPFTSAHVWDRMTQGINDIQTLMYASQNLQQEKPPTKQELVGYIKNIHQNIRELNATYKVAAETYLRSLEGKSPMEVQQAAAEMESRQNAAIDQLSGGMGQ